MLVRACNIEADDDNESDQNVLPDFDQAALLERNTYLASTIVQTIKARNGRFLIKSSSPPEERQHPTTTTITGGNGATSAKKSNVPCTYEEVGESVAVEKTKQTFRHQLRKIQESYQKTTITMLKTGNLLLSSKRRKLIDNSPSEDRLLDNYETTITPSTTGTSLNAQCGRISDSVSSNCSARTDRCSSGGLDSRIGGGTASSMIHVPVTETSSFLRGDNLPSGSERHPTGLQRLTVDDNTRCYLPPPAYHVPRPVMLLRNRPVSQVAYHHDGNSQRKMCSLVYQPLVPLDTHHHGKDLPLYSSDVFHYHHHRKRQEGCLDLDHHHDESRIGWTTTGNQQHPQNRLMARLNNFVPNKESSLLPSSNNFLTSWHETTKVPAVSLSQEQGHRHRDQKQQERPSSSTSAAGVLMRSRPEKSTSPSLEMLVLEQARRDVLLMERLEGEEEQRRGLSLTTRDHSSR